MVQSFDHVHFYYPWPGIWWEVFWLTQFLLTTVLENEINCFSIDFLAESKLCKKESPAFTYIPLLSDLFLSFLLSSFTFDLIQIKFIRQLLNLTTLLFKVYFLFLILLSLINSSEYPLEIIYFFSFWMIKLPQKSWFWTYLKVVGYPLYCFHLKTCLLIVQEKHVCLKVGFSLSHV